MKILVVADEYPWPPVSGSRLRIAAQLEGLVRVGAVDLLCVRDPPSTPDLPAPARLGLARVATFDRSPLGRSPLALFQWMASGRPRSLVWRSWDPIRPRFTEWRAEHYDLAWFTDIPSYLALGSLVRADSIVVDFDDVESAKLAHRRRVHAGPGSSTASLRRRVADAADRFDGRRWKRVETRVSAAVDRILVCSELDRSRVGANNAEVISNGYPAPEGRIPPESSPTGAPRLLFVALLTYPPNVDAARFLAREVLPLVRQTVADATLRLVGLAAPEVEALGVQPGVEVVGPVTEVEPELRQADVAVVPVRFGGGTRVKILEAFAHRVPVVTTTVGCEGIEVEPGRHLLVADDPPSFAAACVSILEDDAIGRRLVDEAKVLFEALYRTDRITEGVAGLARSLVAGSAAG